MWPEDYQLRPDLNYDPYDPDIDLLPEYQDIKIDEDWEEPEEEVPPEPEGEPYWRVHIEYSNGEEQDIRCYIDDLPDRPAELYFALLEFFVTDCDEADELNEAAD